MTTQPTTTTDQERDGLVRTVVRLDDKLQTARQDLTAAEGTAVALRTELKAQRQRARTAEEQLASAQDQVGELGDLVARTGDQLGTAMATPLPSGWTAADLDELVARVVEKLQAGGASSSSSAVETPQEPTRLEANGSSLLVAAGAGPVSADTQARTITGRLVPWGQVGHTNMGRITFAQGSIQLPDDPSEVKLLVEHSQANSVGYATRLWEAQDGLWGTFHVPEGDPDGELALTRARNRVRDAFSVGVDLDEATQQAVTRNRTAKPIQARGALRENSLVSVPAFTGARVTDVAASSSPIVVAAWHTAPTHREDSPSMHTCQHCGAELQPGIQHTCQVQATAAAPATTAPAPAVTVPQEQLQAALLGILGVTPEHAAATAPETPAPAPQVTAGAATTQVVSSPATYSWDGQGHGFIRDLWQATQERNAEAAARLDTFGRELSDCNPRTVATMVRAADPQLLTAAVETRTTAPELVQEEVYRGELLVRAIDRGRPMFQRMRNVRLTDATPFRVPTEGEFDGVGAHTEGTAHVAEGTLELGSTTVEPGAVSGAYRFSRELADSTNPAIDGIALRAMMRDYRRQSEAMVAAALLLKADGATVKEYAAELIDTPEELRAQIIAAALANDEIPPEFAFMGSTAYTLFANAVAGDGRPYFPPLNPTNAAGTSNIRQLAMTVDGMPAAATGALEADNVILASAEDVLVGESGVLSFRFEQPEGPGIIKVAIWAYQVAHVLRDAGVRRLSTADEA